MSVAFRRESDEEHLEPRPELPIPPGPNLVTARGLSLIEAQVKELEAALAAEKDEEAIKAIRRKLRYWHARRATARITPPPTGDEVSFGSRVRFRMGKGPVRTVDIVGEDEAEPEAGRLSFTAPLARALIGAGTGDLVDFGGRPEAIEILSVGPIEN
ncbi:nucleoside-diphosphate kinase [Sphingomonas oleivorans]|uniref:Nucleoside-diphosphate kinase n=1 Tax=Sphingomonas oleivorans TaxID=1735121 RepID=A0A2T5FV48_9SPHN|nr:GreA/GreB family elongation factor [Sphingomonas oleivorans]PTQ08600.1 nucleoside-diphosphate kinase [Sphingomonas oleivorans]